MGSSSGYNSLKLRFNIGCRVLNGIGGVALVAIMLLISGDVISRSLLNAPIDGVFELVEILLAVSVCCGFAYAGVEGAHVTVDFLVDKLGLKTQRKIDIINHFASMTLFALMSWKSFQQSAVLKDTETTTVLLELPVYPYLTIMGTGTGLLAVVYLFRCIDSLKGEVE